MMRIPHLFLYRNSDLVKHGKDKSSNSVNSQSNKQLGSRRRILNNPLKRIGNKSADDQAHSLIYPGCNEYRDKCKREDAFVFTCIRVYQQNKSHKRKRSGGPHKRDKSRVAFEADKEIFNRGHMRGYSAVKCGKHFEQKEEHVNRHCISHYFCHRLNCLFPRIEIAELPDDQS